MRRLLIILGCLLAGVLITLAALPWWLGPVLKSVARRNGAGIGRYERLGYAHFAVHDITVTRPVVKVHIVRAETETPLLWFFHRVFHRPAAVVATEWRVDVRSPEIPSPPSPDSGAMRTRTILFKVADSLDRWLPKAAVGAGVVTWKGGELRLDAAQWERGSLTVRTLRFGDQGADVRMTFAKTDEISLEARSVTPLPWQISLKNVRDEISGELHVWDQAAPLTARLPERGWMPVAMQVRAEHWAVPGAQLKLGQSYATVRGDARLEWRDDRFEASAEITGETIPETKAPPLAAKIHARGDRDTLSIDSLQVDIPGVNARLSDPMVFTRMGGADAGISHFTLEMDLEKQPWISGAKGRITGRAQLTPVTGKFPHLEGTLQAGNVAMREWSIAHFGATTTLDWPRLQLQEAMLGFAGGGQLVVRGVLDLQTKEMSDVTADGVLHRSAVAHWLPEKMQIDSLTLAAKAHGPFTALQHEGKVRVAGFGMTPVKSLAADLIWRGTGGAVEISDGQVQAGASRLLLAGTLDTTGAQVTTLRLEQNGAERFSLAQPAAVQWSPKLRIGPLRLAGPDTSLTLTAITGETGRIETEVRNFSSTLLADFVALPGPEWRLAALDLHGAWDRGPADFSLRGDLAVTLAPGRSANVTVAAQNDGAGIKIESLRVAEGEAAIVNATGRLPLALHPGEPAVMRLEKGAPLLLRATTASNPPFWKKLTEATGLEFEEPEVSVDLSGTWERPQGAVSAKARRVSADPQRIKFAFPTVEMLDVHATADGGGIAVDRLAVQIEGQTVRASGNLPLTLKQWPEFKRAPVEFLRREGNLRLEIPDAEMAAFSRYMGQYLAPAGRLHVDLTLKRGGEMAGTLRVQDAATRPLGPLGVLQDVQVEAQLAGRNIEIKSVTARTGGQPVTLSGKVQLPLEGAPKFDLALKGENLPIVRQTGLLLRADLELKLITQADNVTAVTGAVRLRDSMFLSDVRALIPKGGGGGPSRRPPFFSIETPPLNAWRLGIDVRGDSFLRLRSTMFVGVASARFHLGGTLGEPRATGEGVVNSGQVLLPFATFRVEQGTVRLTEADPYSLRLFLSGTSRRYGYDLHLEVTGNAGDPIVTFSSSPPLEAKQVLLMVMAGELPRDEVTYGSSQRAARLGAYLGQSLINNFGGDTADADRLAISTGERISRQGRETYNIEYGLTKRLTAVAEYDEFDAYNTGVKWRLFRTEKEKKQEADARAAAKKIKEEANAPAP